MRRNDVSLNFAPCAPSKDQAPSCDTPYAKKQDLDEAQEIQERRCRLRERCESQDLVSSRNSRITIRSFNLVETL